MEWLADWEGQFLLFLQGLRTPVLDQIMNVFTSLTNGGVLPILVCVLLLCSRRYRKAGITAALSLLIEFILVNGILKGAVHRTRPYEVIEGLRCITAMPHDFSFPSGHTGSSFAVAAAMFLTMPRGFGVTALILAALTSFSRLYVGVHFPTDVLAGMAAGILTAILAFWILWREEKPGKKNVSGGKAGPG